MKLELAPSPPSYPQAQPIKKKNKLLISPTKPLKQMEGIVYQQ